MKEIKKNPSMTYGEVLQNPSLAHFHEAIHLLQNRSHTDIFPKQYESAMMGVAEGYVVKLFQEVPNLTLKTAITKVIAHLPNDLSDSLITKIKNAIVEKWTQLSAEYKVIEKAQVCV
jgi:hypothetical protein